jgi:hypothetical protein
MKRNVGGVGEGGHMPRTAMSIAGWIFLLIGLLHLVHIVYDLEFKIAGYAMPLGFNVAGSLVFLLLALLMFWSVRVFSRAHL